MRPERRDRLQNAEELPENIKILDLPEARYRIIYENHILSHSPEVLGNADALAVEVGGDTHDYGNPSEAPHISVENGLFVGKPNEKDRAFVQRIVTTRTPVYFMDLVDRKGFGRMEALGSTTLTSAEWVAAAAAGKYLVDRVKSGEKVSRRDFLRGSLATALIAKGTVDAAAKVNSVVDIASGVHTKKSEFGKMLTQANETINPELTAFVLTFRNAIWAHKLQQIASTLRNEKGRKPEIALKIGAGHSGIEGMLQMDPADRLSYIKKVTRVLSAVTEIGPQALSISSMGRFQYSSAVDKFVPTRAYHDPELEKIEQSFSRNVK